MTDAAQNTKLEVLVERFEDFTNAVIDGRASSSLDHPDDIEDVRVAILDARSDLIESLREFVTPSLRLIAGGRQGYAIGVAEKDMIECGLCKRHFKCADENCAHWHKAIQDKLNKVPPPARKSPPRLGKARHKPALPPTGDDEPPRRA